MYITSWLFFFFEFFCANFGYLCPQKLFFKINFVLNFFYLPKILFTTFACKIFNNFLLPNFCFFSTFYSFLFQNFASKQNFVWLIFFPKYFFQSFNKLYTHLLFGSFFYKFLKFLHIFPSKLLLSNFCFLHTFSYRMQGAR